MLEMEKKMSDVVKRKAAGPSNRGHMVCEGELIVNQNTQFPSNLYQGEWEWVAGYGEVVLDGLFCW